MESKVQNYPQAPLLCKNHRGNTAATVSGLVNNVPSVLQLCSVLPIMTVKVVRNIVVSNPAVPVHFLTSVPQH